MYNLIAFHFDIIFFYHQRNKRFWNSTNKNRNVRSEEVAEKLLIEVKYFSKHSGGKYGS